MPSLIDPNLKLSRAKIHLDSMKEAVSLFRKTNKQTTTSDDDIENGLYVISTHIPHDESSFKIALLLGDFVCNLRSSLDHIAWQLALLTCCGDDLPSRDTSFPICEKDSVETQVRIARCTFGIPDEAVAIMKSLQPYKAGKDYRSTHLWRLNTLWNIDKHRHIAPHGVVTDWLFKLDRDHFAADFRYMASKHGIKVEDTGDGCVMKMPLSLKEKVHFNPSPNTGDVDIRFGYEIPTTNAGDSDSGIEMSLGDLIEIYEFVAKRVFPIFSGFFPEPEITRK